MPFALAAAVFAVFIKGQDVFVLNLTESQEQPIEICQGQQRYPITIRSEYRPDYRKLEGSEVFVVGYKDDGPQGGAIFFSGAEPKAKRLTSVDDVRKVVGEISEFVSRRRPEADATGDGGPALGRQVEPGSMLYGPLGPGSVEAKPRGFIAALLDFFGLGHGRAGSDDAARFRKMFMKLDLKSKKVPNQDDLIDIHRPVSPTYELLVYSKALRGDAVGLAGFAIYKGFSDDRAGVPDRRVSCGTSSFLSVSYPRTIQVQQQQQTLQVQTTGPWPGGGGMTCYNAPCPKP